MPVRSLDSPVLRWPDRAAVDRAVRSWALGIARTLGDRVEIVAVGYFGSYARGDWGPGSDVDIVVVTGRSSRLEGTVQQPIDWGTSDLPVPADVLVYTTDDWKRLTGRMGRTLGEETVWVLGSPPD